VARERKRLIMSVYIDNAKASFFRMVMCHMVADTDKELLSMADKIGIHRKWHQFPGKNRSHFDVCLSKRKLAIKAGAVEINRRELGRILNNRRRKRLRQRKRLPQRKRLNSTPVL